MDTQQEQMQFLGLFGIFKESFKIIHSWRKIFTQITLTLILPLTFIFFAHLEVSSLLSRDIMHTKIEKYITSPGTRKYNKLSDTLSSEYITLILFNVAYFTILLILSLLSTAAVVYTIASIYTGRELTFKKVISVVPKVWKRLMVTFLCTFAAFFVYNFIAVVVMTIFIIYLPYSVMSILIYVALIIYGIGFVYMSVIWHVASVVSVLETSYGIQAMKKSNDLIKGNQGIVTAIFFMLNLTLVLIQFLFSHFVVYGSSMRVWFVVLCSLLFLAVFLFQLVVQTIIYLVCKSYHHENIDKGDLSNHLESYLGEYEPLSGKDVQLEQYQV